METTPTKNDQQVAAAIHVSTFAKYFFPFGNFLLPIILWQVNSKKRLVDHHGRQAINFQLSILIYSIAIGIICIPFFVIFASDFIALIEAIDHEMDLDRLNTIKNLSGYILLFAVATLLLTGLFIFELYAVITATTSASKGEYYQYPFCIPFLGRERDVINTSEIAPITTTEETNTETNQNQT